MIYPIKLDKLNPAIEFYSEVKSLQKEAELFLRNHKWCDKIITGWLFTNIGYAVCIFLFEIVNSDSIEDKFIWVITGDFPPMYLDSYNVSSTTEVVEEYIDIVSDWIENAENGKSLQDSYPLASKTDSGTLQLLKSKVKLLSESILPNIEEINFNVAFED